MDILHLFRSSIRLGYVTFRAIVKAHRIRWVHEGRSGQREQNEPMFAQIGQRLGELRFVKDECPNNAWGVSQVNVSIG